MHFKKRRPALALGLSTGYGFYGVWRSQAECFLCTYLYVYGCVTNAASTIVTEDAYKNPNLHKYFYRWEKLENFLYGNIFFITVPKQLIYGTCGPQEKSALWGSVLGSF